MSWTDERVETLKRMWAEGQSASQIAKEIGGVTRNAVIGKVHRLGLSNRGAANGAKPVPGEEPPQEMDDSVAGAMGDGAEPVAAPAEVPEPAGAAAEAANHVSAPANPGPGRKPVVAAGQPLPPQPSANEVSPEALASVREIEKKARKLSLMELTERTCKWPVGDPATPDFWFCGLPVQTGKPYCEAHVGLAFQPMSSRRDRRR